MKISFFFIFSSSEWWFKSTLMDLTSFHSQGYGLEPPKPDVTALKEI
jgi:hypothetical protein